jgi:hypothetical protein
VPLQLSLLPGNPGVCGPIPKGVSVTVVNNVAVNPASNPAGAVAGAVAGVGAPPLPPVGNALPACPTDGAGRASVTGRRNKLLRLSR